MGKVSIDRFDHHLFLVVKTGERYLLDSQEKSYTISEFKNGVRHGK